MLTALLVIIYLSFISLGLPDSLLGAAWPAIHTEMGAPLGFAGVISMVVSCGTVVSSLMSARLIKRFGTGTVTAVSVAMTAGALLGFSFAPSVVWFCVLAVPMGLGAGSVDAALNNFVALHYAARHMNWLHCFWGLGATAGPAVMAFWIARQNNWKAGYLTIGIFQCVLVVVLVAALPLWKRVSALRQESGEEEEARDLPVWKAFRIPGAWAALLGFFCYCGLESITNLWASSYAVSGYSVSAETAAGWSSLFFLGITVGRLLSGFLTIKVKTPAMIRLGECLLLLGCVLLLLPLPVWKIPGALCLIGLGCAPIFPSMLHHTPEVFGKGISQAMMGIQMACAYVGATFMPPVFGALTGVLDIRLFPLFLLAFLVLLVFSTEAIRRHLAAKQTNL